MLTINGTAVAVGVVLFVFLIIKLVTSVGVEDECPGRPLVTSTLLFREATVLAEIASLFETDAVSGVELDSLVNLFIRSLKLLDSSFPE